MTSNESYSIVYDALLSFSLPSGCLTVCVHPTCLSSLLPVRLAALAALLLLVSLSGTHSI
jgi:hypothetical protein